MLQYGVSLHISACSCVSHTHTCTCKTHSKAVWPLASNKDLLIQRWWLTRVSILVWRGYWGIRFSFNYTTVSQRVSCRSLVCQARAELLQIREQGDSAGMQRCGETRGSGYTAADPFMGFKCASHFWDGDENMQIIWESLHIQAHEDNYTQRWHRHDFKTRYSRERRDSLLAEMKRPLPQNEDIRYVWSFCPWKCAFAVTWGDCWWCRRVTEQKEIPLCSISISIRISVFMYFTAAHESFLENSAE